MTARLTPAEVAAMQARVDRPKTLVPLVFGVDEVAPLLADRAADAATIKALREAMRQITKTEHANCSGAQTSGRVDCDCHVEVAERALKGSAT